MAYQDILVEDRELVRWITLNRPDRLNAQTHRLWEELTDAMHSAAADAAVRCIVLTGAGRGFSVGQDLEDPDTTGEPPDEDALLRDFTAFVPLMREMDKLVVSAVNGVAAGAG